MEIIRLNDDDKRKYLDLLLTADEQESMIDRYLDRGDMFVLNDNGVKAECVVTKEAEGVYELCRNRRCSFDTRLLPPMRFYGVAPCQELFHGQLRPPDI